MLLLRTGVYYIYKYSGGSRVTTTVTIYVYCCYRFCHCSFSCWRCTRPTWQRQRRVSHDDGVPLVLSPLLSHLTVLIYALPFSNTIPWQTTPPPTNTADKVLPSSLVSDRVNAVYSFISTNPFDYRISRCLVIICVCLPSSSPPSHPPYTIYLFATRQFGPTNTTNDPRGVTKTTISKDNIVNV